MGSDTIIESAAGAATEAATGRVTVWCLDAEPLTDAELVTAVCAQGLANRAGPRVFLTLRRRQCHSSFEANPLSADGAARLPDEVLARYRSAPEFWVDRYAETHGYAFTPVDGLTGLLDALGDTIKGVVRFSLSNRCELPVAVTVAGIEDAIAVPDESPCGEALLARYPVVMDLRDRFTSRAQAATWALRELMPMCAKDAVFSQNDTNDQRDPDIFSLDLAVAGRMFVFNLDFWEAREPEHFALIRAILGSIEPMSPMYGWGTSEAAMMVAMGPSGSFLICTGCPNLSFHRTVPPRAWPLRTRRVFAPDGVRLEDRCYVTFMVNEGDTLKWMGSVMGAGRWLEAGRGRLPVNWGISPFINQQYAGMMETFYETSSPQDVFVSSISGYGYYGMKHCRHALELADREAAMLGPSDVTAGSIYAVHGMLDATNGVLDAGTEAWLIHRGCRGYLFESSQRPGLWMTGAGQPVIGTDWSLFYWKYRLPGEGADQRRAVAGRIMELGGRGPGPSFVPVYGGSPAEFLDIAAHLDPERFTVVGLDEMIELARQAYPLDIPPPVPVAIAPDPVPPFRGLVLHAPRGGTAGGDPVEIDLAVFGVGRMRAQLRFGWDEQALLVDIEECAAPARACESRHQDGFAAGEFDLADGVGLWFDFNLDGTRERGDYTLRVGFSSRGRGDLWCAMVNDQVLSSVVPRVQVRTSVYLGLRRIHAAIPWSGLAGALDPGHQPAGGLAAAIRPGYTLACQPMLIEGAAGRAFMNGRSNRRENATAAVLQDERARHALPMPSGWDGHSVRVRLAG